MFSLMLVQQRPRTLKSPASEYTWCQAREGGGERERERAARAFNNTCMLIHVYVPTQPRIPTSHTQNAHTAGLSATCERLDTCGRCVCAHPTTHIHIHICIRTRTRVCTHTHAHTHIHIHMPPSFCSPLFCSDDLVCKIVPHHYFKVSLVRIHNKL